MRRTANRRAGRNRPSWHALAQYGQAHWFFGNLYEAMVDMPRLLVDARPRRAPRLLGAGSPVRYYAPAVPLTFGATAAALADSWRSGGDRRAIVAAALGTAWATVLSAYLVRTVNLRLLRGEAPLSAAEAHALARNWHLVNLVRLAALLLAAEALRRAAPPERQAVSRDG
ncbi:hypothetical protein F4561_004245 [Lipingzhangella halophila]|uniref:DUF1772 domain-containing protein n=1 Tax=Lipingzhangella halophila TaxID=1783352 RepID=A0A7W7RK48_9ACTN|nr:DUF1772 domain-containing protein [Lipingzhangella halophila]MBB4933425.1 hypothetical protein [Lipingzhangella halophila]